MRIVQMLPTISYGDAISNHVLAMRDALLRFGYSTDIFAENIDKRLPAGTAKKVSRYHDRKSTVIIYHLSIGSELNDTIKHFKARIVINYHNVTPPEFWENFDRKAAALCRRGIESVQSLAEFPRRCIADSAFNKKELIRLGYKCPINVVPIFIRFEDYEQRPDASILEKNGNNGYTNILFTGRIAPNKKQENVISSFYYYQKYINRKARLFLVGSYQERSSYFQGLTAFVKSLGIEEMVFFTGLVRFEELLAYYKTADLFLCLSEHEGFCVPLAEAMFFHVPIVAFDSTAVGETLGKSGLLLKENEPRFVAEAMNMVLSNSELKDAIIRNEQERLQDFQNDTVASLLNDVLCRL